jgi:hypothetical protein
MSASVGSVFVVNVEHLVEDLVDRGQRVELAALDFVQQPQQLWIVGHGTLQMRLRAGRRD